jgi:small subunit ribosomal protein S1
LSTIIDDDPRQDGNLELDEGWWSSVLSDEEAFETESDVINCSPCVNSESSQIDWECAKKVFEQDQVVLLKVSGFNRGGLLVSGQGIQGFVPISHLVELPLDVSEENKQEFLSTYENRSLYLKIIEFEPTSQRLVLSERAAQAGEGKRRELFEKLKPGAIVCGVLTNVTDFGVFVDLGGVEGLVHVSELSWGRVEDPAALFSIGHQVKVIVLSINDANSRIALSIKRLTPNPWDKLISDYHAGDTLTANITTITRFGMFARLPEGIEGLIHISSIPEFHNSNDLARVFSSGQEVKVKILHMDADRRRLGLGLAEDS